MRDVIDPAALALAATTMGLLVFLAIGVLYSRLHWLAKAALITLTLAVAGISYRAHVSLLGYPVSTIPQDTFRVIAVEIEEPIPVMRKTGAIWVWTKQKGDPEPRAIRLPYDRKTHEQMQKAQDMIRKGKPVHMRGTKQAMEGADGNPGGKSSDRPNNGAQGGSPSSQSGEQGPLDFVAPPSTLPSKN